ncbi:RHS repeat-associated core domain-containing protein [Roseobacter sp. HKCCA0434]|uniref:RHS repeat-associated core domain-containing protein n=1 Tax=Roseobacter sp. HKCCA0434 TaxID=3079297 RepID=UPI002905B673|nr:RHS repeat-associated core domain-containing protein [Roseobacter sp. HKCCA0434]
MELSYEAFGLTTETGRARPYGFTGREIDRGTWLCHYRARSYDPRTGTFLQSDPIGFAAGDLNT